MYSFIYWSNKAKYHEKKLFSCIAESIAVADKLFTDATGINPIATSWVGCQVENKVVDKV